MYLLINRIIYFCKFRVNVYQRFFINHTESECSDLIYTFNQPSTTYIRQFEL